MHGTAYSMHCTWADTNIYTRAHMHANTHTSFMCYFIVHLFISADTHRHLYVCKMRASAYLAALDLKHTHTNTHSLSHTHTLLVKADTKSTMSSLGPSVSLSLLHTLINIDWPGLELRPAAFPSFLCSLLLSFLMPSFSPPQSIIHLSLSFLYSFVSSTPEIPSSIYQSVLSSIKPYPRT